MTLPKLNLRDLFWLVVVVAMGIGWWMERVAREQEVRKLLADHYQAQIELLEEMHRPAREYLDGLRSGEKR